MKKPVVFHPYLFAVYAVLGVFTSQPQEIPVTWLIRPAFLLVAAMFFVLLLLRRYSGNDQQRAGWLAALLLGWLFMGHLRNALFDLLSITPNFSFDILFAVGWGCLLIFLGSPWLWLRIKNPGLLTNFLNVTSWALILVPTYFVLVFTKQAFDQARVVDSGKRIIEPVNLLKEASTKPDIYIIILDAYGRDDFLMESFGYDNREFLDFLVKRGFYIARESRTNYPQTQLSLSSLLNINYLNDWAGGLSSTNNRAPLSEAIRHSEVRRALEEIGYRTVNIPNSTLISTMDDSDVYLPMNPLPLNQFDGLLLSTTVLDIFAQQWDIGISLPGYSNHRKTIQYQLETLKTIPGLDTPKFVFVHILAPHPPFVFDEKGNSVQADFPYTLGDGGGYPGSRKEYIEGYSGQLTHLNHELMELIDIILETSPEPPIIILQGDHGPGNQFDMLSLEGVSCLKERFSIFNAYYFPGGSYYGLHPSITPVNSFRVIFNTFFETDLPLLEDRSYYASYGTPYQYVDVTKEIEVSCPME